MDTTIIRPKRGLFEIDVADIWRHRELFYAFGWRDVSVRYKQTALGVLWAFVQPVATTIVYAISFGKFAKVPSDGIPYILFVFTGLLFWNLFSGAVSRASSSLTANLHIVQKVYFPRIIVPIAAVIASVVDFIVATAMLAGLMIYYQTAPSILGVILIPVLTLWTVAVAVGFGCFASAINAKYRDVAYLLPLLLQLAVFVSPVIYSPVMFEDYRWILNLNPMTGIIEVARYTLLGSGVLHIDAVLSSILITITLLIVGVFYFQHTEQTFADVL